MWWPTRLEDRSDWLHLLTEDGEAMEPRLPMPTRCADHRVRRSSSGEDASRRDTQAEDARAAHPRWHPRCHPRDERIIPKSRDFH